MKQFSDKQVVSCDAYKIDQRWGGILEIYIFLMVQMYHR